MGDPKVTGSAPVFKQPSTATVDDQVSDILNNPRTNERTKVMQMELLFSNLSGPEKQTLCDRLKDRKVAILSPNSFITGYPIQPQGRPALYGWPGPCPNHGRPSTGGQVAKGPARGKGPSPAVMDHKTMEKIRGNALSPPEIFLRNRLSK